MGKPLVPTVFDFGRKGTPPTHPELLDWLAVELIDHGWSMKHVHRQMITSATYRLASGEGVADTPNVKIDPDNRYFWQMNARRVEVELVQEMTIPDNTVARQWNVRPKTCLIRWDYITYVQRGRTSDKLGFSQIRSS